MDAMRHMLAKFPSERNSFRDLLRTVMENTYTRARRQSDAQYLDYFLITRAWCVRRGQGCGRSTSVI